jgi:hypothetical protein
MSVAFVLGGGGRWGAVEVDMLAALVDADIAPAAVLVPRKRDQLRNLVRRRHTLAPDDRRQLDGSDFTDSDELIESARTAAAAYLAGIRG